MFSSSILLLSLYKALSKLTKNRIFSFVKRICGKVLTYRAIRTPMIVEIMRLLVKRKASIPDNDGVLYEGEKIADDGEERLETEIDIVEIERRLKEEGIPVYISTDPGRYVCNNIYYTALYSRKEPSLFVHFPETRDMSEEMEEKALEIIIGYLRETYLSDR